MVKYLYTNGTGLRIVCPSARILYAGFVILRTFMRSFAVGFLMGLAAIVFFAVSVAVLWAIF